MNIKNYLHVLQNSVYNDTFCIFSKNGIVLDYLNVNYIDEVFYCLRNVYNTLK